MHSLWNKSASTRKLEQIEDTEADLRLPKRTKRDPGEVIQDDENARLEQLVHHIQSFDSVWE
jgi:hypothetical protein